MKIYSAKLLVITLFVSIFSGLTFNLDSVLGISGLFVNNAFAQDPTAPPAVMPNFRFYTTDSKPFGKENLKANIPTVIFYFDPTCEHCIQQTQWIKESISSFKGAQIVYVTWEDDITKIDAFKNKYYSGVTTPTITFTKDNDYKIDKYFGESQVPSIFVYDKDRKFKKVFRKEAPAAEILQLIR